MSTRENIRLIARTPSKFIINIDAQSGGSKSGDKISTCPLVITSEI